MVLSDRDIRAAIDAGRIGIDPFDPKCVQPASVDIRLDHRFRVFRSSRHAFIDLARPLDDITELVQVPPKTPFILHPNEFVLGSTRERIRQEARDRRVAEQITLPIAEPVVAGPPRRRRR